MKTAINIKAYLFTLIKILVSVLLLYWLINMVTFENLIYTLKLLSPLNILLAMVAVALAIFTGTVKWGYILKALKIDFKWRYIWQLYWAGTFCNNFSPGGLGLDALRIYHMESRDNRGVDSAYSVILERILAILSLGIIGILSYIYCNRQIPIMPFVFISLTLVGFLLTILMVYGKKSNLNSNNKESSYVKSSFARTLLDKIYSFLNKLILNAEKVKQSLSYIFVSFIFTVLFHMSNILLNLILFKSMGVDVDFGFVALLTITTSVLSMLPISINGFGLREGGYMLISSYFNIPREVALSVSVCFALIVSLTSLYGGYFFFFKLKEKQNE